MPISEHNEGVQRISREPKDLTAGRLIARNTIWNLVGEGAPLLVAAFAIPALVRGLGTDRFGILLIGWLLIGYLGLFDLGMGRALTNLVAQRLGKGEEESLPPLIWTASALMLCFGVIAALALAGVSHWLAYSILKTPAALKHETVIALYLLSAALPAVISSTGFRGVLEAYQRFDVANAVRIPMGAFSFAGPLAVLPFSHSLIPVVATLVASRYAGLIAYYILGRVLLPVLRSPLEWRSSHVRPLLSFGGWLTVSNMLSPLMSGMDRFYLGALLSVKAVAYYATPFDVVTKLLIIPVAVDGVLFPAFSTTFLTDLPRARQFYRRARKVLALTMAPIVVAVILSARVGLKIWLGETFAANSTSVMQLLAIGIFLNSIAQPAYALVQGSGRTNWTGKMHLAEVPFYLTLFWVLTSHFGIVGAAFAWLVRIAEDAFVLLFMANRLLYHREQLSAKTGATDAGSNF